MATQTNSPEITKVPLDDALDLILNQMVNQFRTGRKMGATPILLGDAGSGKTANSMSTLLTDGARMLGADIYGSKFDLLSVNPLDLSGAAFPANLDSPEPTLGRTRPDPLVLPPAEVIANYKHVLIFVDEIDKGPIDNRLAVASLLQENRLGLYDLPYDRFFVVGAGNHTSSTAGGEPLPLHLTNRSGLYHVTPSFRRWLGGYSLDPINGIMMIARAFVEADIGGMFSNPAPLPTTDNTPFLTLRSFTQAVQGLPYALFTDGFDRHGLADVSDPRLIDRILAPGNRYRAETYLASVMGSAAARQFLLYAEHAHKLPTRKEVESDPMQARLPTYATDPSALHVAASYLLGWLAADKQAGTKTPRAALEAFTTYAGRFDASKRTALMVKMQAANPQIAVVPAFVKFAAENADLVRAAVAR